ncbi:hypothetical protein LEP1GSC172_0309 [Leptospira noguchii]|uniref:Uncharacterized protein n=2 Tax=Leptospira noguchii TaxID=28182 RepID=T0FEQ6_9LEPT|nr:hypothetical protein LEP1GSC172_0309 [Leptospira noguchii]EQA71673.1 hypothetical protein LEP1GSC059_0810 [Leptospira noguchii serovar Panama str. CZ214]
MDTRKFSLSRSFNVRDTIENLGKNKIYKELLNEYELF